MKLYFLTIISLGAVILVAYLCKEWNSQ